MNELVLCRVSYLKEAGTKGEELSTDTNKNPNVVLLPVAGRLAVKRNSKTGAVGHAAIISGTSAINNGILNGDRSINGTLQLIMVDEKERDEEFGRQFEYTHLSVVGNSDILTYRKELGDGVGVDCSNSVEKDDNGEENKGEGAAKFNLNTSGIGNKEPATDPKKK